MCGPVSLQPRLVQLGLFHVAPHSYGPGACVQCTPCRHSVGSPPSDSVHITACEAPAGGEAAQMVHCSLAGIPHALPAS